MKTNLGASTESHGNSSTEEQTFPVLSLGEASVRASTIAKGFAELQPLPSLVPKIASTLLETLPVKGVELTAGVERQEIRALAGDPITSTAESYPLLSSGKSVALLQLEWSDVPRDSPDGLLNALLPWLEIAIGNALRFTELTESYDLVSRTVDVRTDELTSMSAMLQDSLAVVLEADRQKSEFFTNASHELRTPVTLLLSQLESLSKLNGFPEEAERPLRSAVRSGHRLIKIINDILDLSKIEAGRMELRYEVVDAQALLENVAAPFQEALNRRDIVMETHCNRGLSFIADSERVEQILLNLVSNAVRHTPDGGHVRLSANQMDLGIQLSVENTGEGLSEEDHARLFERFGQSMKSPGRRFGSTGLGLPLVKELVTLHGGRIDVESVPGAKITFRVFLPKVSERSLEMPLAVPAAGASEIRQYLAIAEPPPATVSSDHGFSAARSHLVIAEDNPELRALLASSLASDFSISEAEDGEEALRLVRELRPDLLLSDVMMPGIDGMELCRLIKSDPQTAIIPVVLLTARADLESKLAGLNIGADDYIVKPFHASEVSARLKSQLRLRGLAAQVAQSEKLAALGTLVAGVAHEVRNPLNGVLNSLLPLKELLAAEGPEVAELLELAIVSARRVEQISSQLLTQARVGEGVRSIVDVQQNIEFALKLLTHKTKNGPRIRREFLAGQSLQVIGEPGALNQVWVNLIDNAIAGAGSIGEVIVRATQQGTSVVVEVENTGPCIPPQVLGRIFDPFFTTKAVGQGTGLGLSVVQESVRHHAGTVTVTSKQGELTRFRVTLPALDVRSDN